MSWIVNLKNKINIVDLMIEDGLELKRDGTNRYTCRCPFHIEKTPSFKVSEEYQNYKCFGCGEYGDAIQYYAKRNVLDYYTAAKLLAEKYGIKVKEQNNDYSEYLIKLMNIVEDLTIFYNKKFNELENEHPCKKQITDRNLEINKNDFGYAPSIKELNKFLKKYDKNDLNELGLLDKNSNPILHDRLIFFIKNYMGKPIGFSGRSLEKNVSSYKYINSKSSKVFNKQIALYNIEQAKEKAKKEKKIYIVEGQFDVISMKQNNYENTVCISGTALTNLHLKEILRCVTENGKIVLVLDSDEAGFKAINKVFQSFPIIHENLYVIELQEGKDPCDYLKENDKLPKEEFLISYLFNKIKKESDFNTLEDRQEFVSKIQENLTQYIQNKNLKEQYLKNACVLTGIKIDNLKVKTNKTKQEDAKKVKKYKLPNIEDEYFVASLSFYITHKDILKFKINNKFYPKRYHQTIEELNKTKKFILENFTNQNLAKIISNIYFDKIEDKEIAKKHYKTLLNQAIKITKEKKEKTKYIDLIQEANDLTTDEIIKLLEEKDI